MNNRINPEQRAPVRIDGIIYQLTFDECRAVSHYDFSHIDKDLHNLDEEGKPGEIAQDAFEALNEAGATQWMDVLDQVLPI